MSKNLITAIVIIAPLFVFSQNNYENKKENANQMAIGYQIGLNVSGIKEEANMEQSPRFGFNTGFVLDMRICKIITIQPALLLSAKGCRYGYTDTYSEFDYDKHSLHTNIFYLELPINGLVNIPIKKGKFFLGGGLYLAYGIYGKDRYIVAVKRLGETEFHTEEYFYLFKKEDEKLYNPFDFGINFLGGYEFSSGLYMKAGYGLGLKNIAYSANWETNTGSYNRCFDLSIGYKIKF